MLRSGIIGEIMGHTEKPLTRGEALGMLESGECRVMLRVESRHEEPRQRRGAYNNGCFDRCVHGVLGTDDSALRSTHPTPDNDAGLSSIWNSLSYDGESTHYLFGFNKYTQFKNWFFLDDMLECEEQFSVLGVYIVSKKHSYTGQFQMIGDRRDMIHLMDLPMTYKLDETLQDLFDAQEAACT